MHALACLHSGWVGQPYQAAAHMLGGLTWKTTLCFLAVACHLWTLTLLLRDKVYTTSLPGKNEHRLSKSCLPWAVDGLD